MSTELMKLFLFSAMLCHILEAALNKGDRNVCATTSTEDEVYVRSRARREHYTYKRFCFRFPPSCTELGTMYRTEYVTDVRKVNVIKYACCPHYYLTGDQCKPICSGGCGMGECHSPGNCTCPLQWSGARCNEPVCREKCVKGFCSSPEHCSCDEGYEGKTCAKPLCPQGCSHGTCTSPGQCTCQPEWEGPSCDKAICPKGCGHGYCIFPRFCRCDDGWEGQTCDKAICHEDCGHGFCSFPGICTCDSGWKGPMCAQQCPKGFYGSMCSEECDCSNHSCNPLDGRCWCGDGYIGARCEQRCPPSTFGEGCEEECQCENGGVCHHVDGTCDCQPGFEGVLCENTCQVGFYGYNCNHLCLCNETTSECDFRSGICNCLPGWTGETCDQKCQNQTYGTECELPCFCKDECHHVTGDCICSQGWTGPNCSEQATPGALRVPEKWNISLASCLSLLLLWIIALFLVYMFKRRRKPVHKISEISKPLCSESTNFFDSACCSRTGGTAVDNIYEMVKEKASTQQPLYQNDGSTTDSGSAVSFRGLSVSYCTYDDTNVIYEELNYKDPSTLQKDADCDQDETATDVKESIPLDNCQDNQIYGLTNPLPLPPKMGETKEAGPPICEKPKSFYDKKNIYSNADIEVYALSKKSAKESKKSREEEQKMCLPDKQDVS